PALMQAPDSVEGLIARGREALEAGKVPEAQKLFEQAAEKDGSSLRTRTWVIRSWMEQGRINDSLDAIDAIARGGAIAKGRAGAKDGPTTKGDASAKGGVSGKEIDYLYGMAF